jgi:hypothetical protein
VDGTGPTSNYGMVKAKYSNSTGKLTTLTTGGNLHVYNVNGCAGLINTGDATTFSGSYATSPKQTITSPQPQQDRRGTISGPASSPGRPLSHLGRTGRI